jgi:hypothetical protein
VLQPVPRDPVDRAEGLVHEEDGRVHAQGPRHAHALALATRQLVGVAVAERGRVKTDELQQLVDPPVDAVVGPSAEPGDGGDVLADGLMREQAHLLDHVAHPSPEQHRVGPGDVLAVEQDAARRGLD